MPTGVMMISVCENNPETDIVFHIIVDDSIKTEDPKDLENIVISYTGKSVVFYNANERMLKKPFRKGRLKPSPQKAAYYRVKVLRLLNFVKKNGWIKN